MSSGGAGARGMEIRAWQSDYGLLLFTLPLPGDSYVVPFWNQKELHRSLQVLQYSGARIRM